MKSSSSSSDETYTNETCTNDSQTIHGKQKRKQRGVTMMAKLTKIYNSSNEWPIKFNDVYSIFDGPYSSLFKGYVAFIGCSKVNILIND